MSYKFNPFIGNFDIDTTGGVVVPTSGVTGKPLMINGGVTSFYNEIYFDAAANLMPNYWGGTTPALVIDGSTAVADAAGGAGLIFKSNPSTNNNYFFITTQDNDDLSVATSIIAITTGINTLGNSGGIEIQSGNAQLSTGSARLVSGHSTSGASGTVQLISGNGTDTGDIQLVTGSATNNSGNILVQTGLPGSTPYLTTFPGTLSPGHFNGNLSTYRYGQTFTPTSAISVSRIDVRMKRGVSAASGDIRCQIYDTNGTIPTTLISTATNTYDSANLTTVYQTVSFTFSGVNLASLTKYAFVLDDNGTTNTGDITFETGTSYSSHGYVFFEVGIGPWNIGSADDATFSIFTVVQGDIKFIKTGIPSVSGQVWTASKTDGTGYWSNPPQVTYPLTASAGSNTAPSYSFSGDTNTGMFQIAGDVLAFTTGGTSRFVLSTTDMNVSAGMTNNYLAGTSVIKFHNTGGGNNVTLRGNASQSVNTVFQLPPTNGTNGFLLQTDGTGVTSWVASGANKQLSNLSAPTSIGVDLLFSGSFNIGDAINPVATLNSNTIRNPLGGINIFADAGSLDITTANDEIHLYADTVAPSLFFWDNTTNFAVALKAPGTLAADYTLTLPPNNGDAGQPIITDGNGITSFYNQVYFDSASNLLNQYWGGNIAATVINGGTSVADSSGAAGLIFKSSPSINQNYFLISTEDYASGSTPSSSMEIRTGVQAGSTNSGSILLTSGDLYSPNTSASGSVQIKTGNGGDGSSGAIFVSSGPSVGNTGGVAISSGNSSSANSGDISLNTGSSPGTRGKIYCQSRVFGLPTATSDPTGIDKGEMYFNTTINKIKVYNGTTWETVTSV